MSDNRTGLLGEHGPEAVIPLRGRVFMAAPGTPPPTFGPPRHPVCLRYQEVVPDGTGLGSRVVYSCECGGEGCPDQPGRPAFSVGRLVPGSQSFVVPPLPRWTFDAEAAREAFERIGRGFQALTVSFRTARLAFERIRRVLFGADAPRSPYVRKIRSDYRRKSKARARRGRR